MEIDRTDPNTTIIREKPVFVPAFTLMFVVIGLANLVLGVLNDNLDGNGIFGIGACLVIGGGLFLYSARRCEYRFDTRRREFRWVQKSLLRTRGGTFSFDDVERVILQRPGSEDQTHRVVLYTSHGQFPLSNAYTNNKPQLQKALAAIEEALDLIPTR